MTTCVKGRLSLHKVAVRWLMDRANPESQGGLGVFADTRHCALRTFPPGYSSVPADYAGRPGR